MTLLDEPRCTQKNCFAFSNGHCKCLRNTEFKKGCPFFKDKSKANLLEIEEEIKGYGNYYNKIL